MRDRRPSDWAVDLSGRHEIEAQVGEALRAHCTLGLAHDSTNSFDRLDYQVLCADQLIELEVKAKHQPLSVGWQRLRPEVRPVDLFVLDELAVRKIVDAGRYTFLLVRDVPANRWCLWSAGDLVVASRVRHTRRLGTGSQRCKGKLLFDLSEAGHVTTSLVDALDSLCATVGHLELWWRDIAPWPALGGAPR